MTLPIRSPAVSGSEAQIARTACAQLATFLRKGFGLTFTVTGAHGQEAVLLPHSVGGLLMEILENVGAGRDLAVLHRETELTTQQAADYLNISRPYLVRLLEAGDIPFRKVGSHRRVRFEDLREYKHTTDAARRKALDALAADAQDLHMGY